MCSNSPKVRLRIDWDADGVFASLTRPGEAAEEVRLSTDDTVRIMKEAAEAWLQTREQVRVVLAKAPEDISLPPLIGHTRWRLLED